MARHSKRDLQARIRRELRLTDSQLEGFISRLSTIIDQAFSTVIEQIQAGDLTGINAARVLSGVESILQELGFADSMQSVQEIFAQQLIDVQSYYSEVLGIEQALADVDIETLEALAGFEVGRIATTTEQYLGDARSVLMKQVLVGQQVDYAAVKEQFADARLDRIKTEVETARAGMQRTAMQLQAERLGLDRYLYIGPLDGVTRPFCREVLLDRSPPIYTRKEIEALDARSNHPGPLPVMTFGGGYNCRHTWAAVTDDFELDTFEDDTTQQ